MTDAERNKTVMEHKGLAYETAKLLWDNPIVKRIGNLDDVSQIALIALMKAVEKYEEGRGRTFPSYAIFVMKRAVFGVALSKGLIHVAAWNFGSRKTEKSVKLLSKVLNIEYGKILDEAVPGPAKELFYSDDDLHGALNHLEERRRLIVEHRFGMNGKPLKTYKELGSLLGIPHQNVQAMLKQALKELSLLLGIKERVKPKNSNAKKTMCRYGHPYDKENTYLRKDGGRECKACRLVTAHARKAARG